MIPFNCSSGARESLVQSRAMWKSTLFLSLLLSVCVRADTIVLDNGRSYDGHFNGPPDTRLSFQDTQGTQYQFPIGDIQSIAFTPSGDTVTLRNGRSYWGQLTGPENNMVPFVDQQGISYRFPSNEVSSIVFSIGWRGPYTSTGQGIVLPAGAEISVMSNLPIDSRYAQPGQTFPAAITQDVLDANGQVVIPRNSDATLMLRSEAGGGIHKGDIVLDLDSVTINGIRHRVATSDVVQTAGKSRHRTAKFLGGGAVLGALIGAVAGGGRGAAIGAAAGAGAGAISEVTTHGKHVYVPAETTLTFSLEQALVLRPYRQ